MFDGGWPQGERHADGTTPQERPARPVLGRRRKLNERVAVREAAADGRRLAHHHLAVDRRGELDAPIAA